MPGRHHSPLFVTLPRGRPAGATSAENADARPEIPAIADCRQWIPQSPEKPLFTRVAGIFLFLPLLARLRFDQIVREAGYPGSKAIPGLSALLSLLALKLLDKERRTHISDYNFDEALGRFAGLNVLPKKSFASDYSYRTQRRQQEKLLSGWRAQLSPLLLTNARAFCLDFHAIPFRGDPTGLDNHYLPSRGKAGPSVLTFFAQEHQSQVLCYANANLTRADQAGELLHFVDFWRALTGEDPEGLSFDSKLTTHAELSRVNERGIAFITIRRRGAAVLRRLAQLPATTWQRSIIDIPKRRHRHIRYVDESVRLSNYAGSVRQVAVTGLGREQPTLFLSNQRQATARDLVTRYAGRNHIEDGLGSGVDFFHLDCLSSDVRLNVDLDVALTVLANGCYRWLARQLKNFDQAKPKQLYRKFVETAGTLVLDNDRLLVCFEKRAHNPVLRTYKGGG